MERDHVTRVVYRELLDVMHERGGYVKRSEVAGACLVTPEEAEHAVERLLKSGRIAEQAGKLSNLRVLAGLISREAYLQEKAAAGMASAKARKERTGTAQPPNTRRTGVQQTPKAPGTPPEPSVSVSVSLPVNGRTDGRPSSPANPLVSGQRPSLEVELLRLVRREAELTDRDGMEVMSEVTGYEGATRSKLNPATMSDDRLANSVLDARARVKKLEAADAVKKSGATTPGGHGVQGVSGTGGTVGSAPYDPALPFLDGPGGTGDVRARGRK